MNEGSYERQRQGIEITKAFPSPPEVTVGSYQLSGENDNPRNLFVSVPSRGLGVLTWYFATPMQVYFLFPYPPEVTRGFLPDHGMMKHGFQ